MKKKTSIKALFKLADMYGINSTKIANKSGLHPVYVRKVKSIGRDSYRVRIAIVALINELKNKLNKEKLRL